jgi:mutator protein MutT
MTMKVFYRGVRRIIRRRSPSTPQAGAIVSRLNGEQLQVLLISRKDDTRRWGFPKGHIEKAETAEECALRELREEAGVTGQIVAYVGAVEYATATRRLRVDFFLARALSEAEPEKGRNARWCDLETAKRLLSNPSARTLLERAWPEIRSALTS